MTVYQQAFWFVVWLTAVVVVEWIARRRAKRILESNAATVYANALNVKSNNEVLSALRKYIEETQQLKELQKAVNARGGYVSRGGIA